MLEVIKALGVTAAVGLGAAGGAGALPRPSRTVGLLEKGY